jgi:hypothetical protein
MPQNLNPGNFNRKVSVCICTSTKTSSGAPNKAYTHSFYWNMSREQALSGQEQYVNNRMVVPYRFIYKGHYKAIDETMQLVDENVKYNILSVNPDDRKMFIEIIAERITE